MQPSGSLVLVKPFARVRQFISRGTHPNLEMLVEQARRCELACDLLLEMLHASGASEALLDHIRQLEVEAHRANSALTASLRSSFLTPLDVEDVQSLSNALVRILQSVRRVAHNALMLPERASLIHIQREIDGTVSGICRTIQVIVERGPAFEPAVAVLRRQREVRFALRAAAASAMAASAGDIHGLLAYHQTHASLGELVKRLHKAITGLQWLILKNG